MTTLAPPTPTKVSTNQPTTTTDEFPFSHDPMSALNLHYQTKIKEYHHLVLPRKDYDTPIPHPPTISSFSLKQQFEFISTRNTQGILHWRSIFTCPLTQKQTNSRIVSSFVHENNGVMIDGYVYYTSKKKSQKMTAFEVCWELFSKHSTNQMKETNTRTTSTPSNSIVDHPSTMEITSSSTRKDTNEISNENETIIHSEQYQKEFDDMLQLVRHPNWVTKLFALGITSRNVQVVFQEEEPEDVLNTMTLQTEDEQHLHPSHYSIDPLLNSTLIQCTLRITMECGIMEITGEGSSTKTKAVQTAVESFFRKLPKDKLSHTYPDCSNSLSKNSPTITIMKKRLNDLEKALQPKMTTLHYPLASYFRRIIKVDQPMLLYEIRFQGGGFPWLRKDQESNAKEWNCYTPMGILFRSTLTESESQCMSRLESEFSIPSPWGDQGSHEDDDSSPNHIVQVELVRERIVPPHSITNHQLAHIHHFNHILLCKGKQYGQENSSNVRRQMENSFQEPNDKVPLYCKKNTRGYLFVPLLYQDDISPPTQRPILEDKSRLCHEMIRIDWRMLSDVYDDICTPLVTCFDFYLSSKYIPYIGKPNTFVMTMTFFLLSIFFFIPSFHHMVSLPSTSNMEDRNWWKYIPLEASIEQDLGFLCLGISCLSFCAYKLQTAIWKFPIGCLRNRYMRQTHAANSLYIYNPTSGQNTPTSAPRNCHTLFLPSDAIVSHKKQEYYKRKFNLDLMNATFGDYYTKKYGYEPRFPYEQLLPVRNTEKVMEYDPTRILVEDPNQSPIHSAKSEENGVYILPELVKVMPIPRDILYTFQYANLFMPSIEREFELQYIHDNLMTLGNDFSQSLSHNPADFVLWQQEQKQRAVFAVRNRPRSFVSLLREATTTTPSITYNVLEFVGDTILSYFLSMKLLSRNAPLTLDVDDLEEIRSYACTNKIIAEKGLNCGIHRLLYVGSCKWSHCSFPDNHPAVQHDQSLKDFVSDKSVADVTEALLAVPFFGCQTLDIASNIILGILEKLDLPLIRYETSQQNDNDKWKNLLSPCLCQSYPFHLDESWTHELNQIESTLRSPIGQKYNCTFDFGKLSDRRASFVEKVGIGHSGMQKGVSKILLEVALFDDDLDIEDSVELVNESKTVENDDVSNEKCSIPPELLRIALLRDTLFIVGNSALHMVLSAELYSRYPSATAGDLHLLRVCGGDCDDLLVYIMIKNGIHLHLYDETNENLNFMVQEIVSGDNLGRERWKKNNGWILNNGTEEFKRRKKNASRWLQVTEQQKMKIVNQPPMYVGLGGGRIMGKKHKLKPRLTDDLAFSMKVSTYMMYDYDSFCSQQSNISVIQLQFTS